MGIGNIVICRPAGGRTIYIEAFTVIIIRDGKGDRMVTVNRGSTVMSIFFKEIFLIVQMLATSILNFSRT